MGYLKCKSCGGIYQLKSDESPDDFEKCDCGGELEYFDTNKTSDMVSVTNRTILRIGLFIVALLAINMILSQIFGGILGVMAYFGSAWGAILIPLFIIGGIVLIIALIWYGWKK